MNTDNARGSFPPRRRYGGRAPHNKRARHLIKGFVPYWNMQLWEEDRFRVAVIAPPEFASLVLRAINEAVENSSIGVDYALDVLARSDAQITVWEGSDFLGVLRVWNGVVTIMPSLKPDDPENRLNPQHRHWKSPSDSWWLTAKQILDFALRRIDKFSESTTEAVVRVE